MDSTIKIAIADSKTVDLAAPQVALSTERPMFPLLDLAPELRQRVFECFFERCRIAIRCRGPFDSHAPYSDDEEYDDYENDFGWLALTRTSQQIRRESLHALLRVAMFDFQLLDQNPRWLPNDYLRSHIAQMKNFFGPPRLLHHLGYTTLSYDSNSGDNSRWVETCVADHIVCDMIVDQFDIIDAMTSDQSKEAQFFEGLKKAIAGPYGSRLTMCVRVDDDEPTWSALDEPNKRSGFQVWKKKVIIRRRPKTERGKERLKNTLRLLGLEIREQDQKLVEVMRNEPVPDNNNTNNVNISEDIDDSINADMDINADDNDTGNLHESSTDDLDSSVEETNNDWSVEPADIEETSMVNTNVDNAYQWWSGAQDD